MKSFLILGLVAMFCVACDKAAEPAKAPATDAGKTGPAAVIADAKDAVATATAAAQTLEVGCAKCTYHLDGAATCGTAVKVGGTAYAVNVPGFDAMKEGLCAGAKQAKVTGEMKDGKFLASKIELIK